MHNIDRIMNEENEYGFLQGEEEAYGYEFDFEGENEHEGEWGIFQGEEEWEWAGEYEDEYLNEDMEYELASELLAITNEDELDQFLGKLVRRVGGGISRFAKSGLGKSLIGGLKSVAKVGLPMLGKVAGTAFGGPLGGMIGGKLGSFASRMFEIQGEGMSNEDLEFEVARRYVRLASAATRNTIKTAKKPGSPKTKVTAAIKKAAAQHAPGLARTISTNINTTGGGSYSMSDPSRQSGTWSRQGNRIILHGV